MLADFDEWITEEFAHGSFTALIIVVDVDEAAVEPVASTYLHVIGDDIEWRDMHKMLSGAPGRWNAVGFFASRGASGPVADGLAKVRLAELEERVRGNRLELNSGAFFDDRGRRMLVEEMDPGSGC